MATPEEHQTWARQAYDEACRLHTSTQYRWATVAYFYAALHMVRHALPQVPGVPFDMQHPDAHTGRYGMDSVVREYLPEVKIAYKTLFDASIDVRYHGGETTRDSIEHYRRECLPVVGSEVCRRVHSARCDCWMRAL